MSGEWFVDTNVLVYSRDGTDPDKQRRAEVWMSWLWAHRQGRISTQVLNEYYVTVTRKLAHPLPTPEAQRHVRQLLTWQPIVTDEAVWNAAWHTEARFDLSWWDSLIVGAARVGGCPHLLTEDLQAGQDLDGVRIVNPFETPPPSASPAG